MSETHYVVMRKRETKILDPDDPIFLAHEAFNARINCYFPDGLCLFMFFASIAIGFCVLFSFDPMDSWSRPWTYFAGGLATGFWILFRITFQHLAFKHFGPNWREEIKDWNSKCGHCEIGS